MMDEEVLALLREAEAFPLGRDVQAAACRVPLLVADLPEADIFDPEATITVETYLKYLRYLCVNSACDCSVGEDETCAHLAAMLRREILPALKPLYRAAVVAAVGVDAWKALAALEEEDNKAEHEDANDKVQVDHEDDEEGLAAPGLDHEGYEVGIAVLQRVVDEATLALSHAHPTV